MKSRTVGVALLLSSIAIPTHAQTENARLPVAEYIFTGDGRFSFDTEDVVGVRFDNTTDNSDKIKVLFIELRPAKQLLWVKMNEPNAGSELSYTLCGKVMGTVFQQTPLTGKASMMVPINELEWANSVLLGRRECSES